MVHLRFTVSALVVLASSSFAAPFANIKFADSLTAQARVFTGSFYLENVASGKRVSYDRTGGTPDLGFSSDGSPMQISVVKDKWVRLEADFSSKCFSAQWDPDHGINHAATLYACCEHAADCDNGSNQGPLRYEKQSYLFVPVDAGAVSRAANASPERRRSLNPRHAPLVPSGSARVNILRKFRRRSDSLDERASDSDDLAVQFLRDDEGKNGVLKAFHLEDLFGSSARQAAAPQGSLGSFYIVAVDHIEDMRTRVVTASLLTTAGDYKSLALADIDENDEKQQWTVYRA